MRTCNRAFKVGYTEPSKFHTFTNICFRERRGESLWIDKPVSLTLKHTLCILTLQGSGQESLGEDSIFVSFLEAPIDSFYSASESERSNFRIPRNLFTCHWIRIASIVLCLDLQSLPTRVNELRGILKFSRQGDELRGILKFSRQSNRETC